LNQTFLGHTFLTTPIDGGETIAIVGESGSGKTALGRGVRVEKVGKFANQIMFILLYKH